MDILGGYGSDSSSSDDDAETALSSAAKHRVEPTSSGQTKQKADALGGLVGGYSDDSSSDDEHQQTEKKQASQKPKKRQRMNSNDKASTTTSIAPFQPKLDNEDTSMILWKRNYLNVSPLKPASSSSIPPSFQSVMMNYAKQSSPKNGVSYQLKQQHEFHNPSFFAKVVKHFGIATSASSNIIEDWEYRAAGLPTPGEQKQVAASSSSK
eukprot:CAMPEP_0119571642 /NCGR_PEP_ID=MMETSP1352-20130426/44225_1 /TAXON_ID=265584 /ORGANISM="Stauroneis constricta, Strain CCMP1120" /LENGTH=208 /DNA_ID=CAMNT_0007621325 /DNA_START=56 /DNA_END=682 /DNA_ORIENTATION=+